MGWRYECRKCGSGDVDYLGSDKWYCNSCEAEAPVRETYIPHPYERARAAVYATGNRWAIENWEATHG